MKYHIKLSKIALITVILVAGGSFIWWAKNRPSTLQMQIRQNIEMGNQAAVISQYQRLLTQKNLPPEEEIQLRQALGEFYWDSGNVSGTLFVQSWGDWTSTPKRPFINNAKAQFDRILELDGKNSMAHLYLGLMQLVDGKDKFALEELELSRQYDPTNPAPLYYQAKIHLERGNPDKARELALQALSLNPGLDQARFTLANVYGELGDVEKAIKEYKRVSSAYKSIPEVRAQFALNLAEQNEWDLSTKEIDAALQKEPHNPWVKLFQGRILLQKYLFDEAFGEFASAANLDPRLPWPLVRIVQAHSLKGECHQAQQGAERLNRVLTRWPWTHFARGWAAICKGKDRDATNALEEALRLNPKFNEAAFLKAQIHLDKGQYDHLGSTIRPLLDFKINESQAFALLAQSLFEQGLYDLAEEAVDAAIKSQPRNPWGHIWRGYIEAERAHWNAADRAFVKAFSLNEWDPHVAGHFALYNAMRGELKSAQITIEAALQRHPHSAQLWSIQGDIHRSQKFYTEAIQAYKQAISISPYFLQAHLGLVKSYWANGSKKSAKTAWLNASRVNPKHPLVLVWKQKFS